MINIKILTKFIIDINEVNKMLEEGWEFEQLYRGINKEIYILHKYIQEEKEIKKEKRKERIFILIGEIAVILSILTIVIGLFRKYFS